MLSVEWRCRTSSSAGASSGVGPVILRRVDAEGPVSYLHCSESTDPFAVADASMIVETTEIEFRISNEELRIKKGDQADEHSQFFIRNSKFEIRNSKFNLRPRAEARADRRATRIAGS